MPQGSQKTKKRQIFRRESELNFKLKIDTATSSQQNAKFPHFSPDHFRFRFQPKVNPAFKKSLSLMSLTSELFERFV